ncbi:Stem-specific protein TSJT1, partial [Mucuna pruriens]
MLGIFKEKLVNPPQELNSPESLNSSKRNSNPKSFGNDALLAYSPSNKPSIHQENECALSFISHSHAKVSHRFCVLDNIYCIFLGSLNNLSKLIKRYDLSKGTNEAMFIIEAYRTLRDRSPYPADQVLKELEGSFGFVIYDHKDATVFTALVQHVVFEQGSDGKIGFFWGIAADGSVVMSENLELIKGSCGKSFAPFPTRCMFHSANGLMS